MNTAAASTDLALLPLTSTTTLLTFQKKSVALSSRGVNRGFVIFFLEKLLAYAQNVARETQAGIHFPLADSIIQSILTSCVEALSSSATLRNKAAMLYSGSVFSTSNTSTYWTVPSQFRTWWKNNVERMARFKACKDLEGSQNNDKKALKFRHVAILLCENIRNHFTRHVARNGGVLSTYQHPPEESLLSEVPALPLPIKKSSMFGNFGGSEMDDGKAKNFVTLADQASRIEPSSAPIESDAHKSPEAPAGYFSRLLSEVEEASQDRRTSRFEAADPMHDALYFKKQRIF